MPTKCVINTTTEVTVTPPKKHYIKIYDRYNDPNFIIVTKEQLYLLNWLNNNLSHDIEWEEVNPNDIFEEI